MKLIQGNGQPIYGRFENAVSEINIEDYQNKFLNNEFKKKLRYKKFSFIGIQHQEFSIGFAVADLAWVGHGFYYCYQRKTEQAQDYHALSPLALSTQVQEATQKNQFNCFKHADIEIFSKQNKKSRQLIVRQSSHILCEAEIDLTQRQPLYMCSPTGVRGWTYTHKSMALPVKGYINFAGEKIEFDEKTLASIDDSCGFLRPETEWFWLSCQTWINGQKIALNFASGVNESVSNENCLWVDGRLYAMSDVIFERLGDRIWHIYTLDQTVDLTVYTAWRRYEKINAGLIASEFSQWMATIEGSILFEDDKITFDSAYALLEEHYAKW